MSSSRPFHAAALLTTKPSLCGRNGKLATRPVDVTCGQCWRVMLARRMMTVREIPDHIELLIARRLCLELGLPVAPMAVGGSARGPAMSREQVSAAKKLIPLSEVRRMLRERDRENAHFTRWSESEGFS